MASAAGQPAADLIARLLAAPERFSFFQLVRLLERARPGCARLGRQGPAAEEVVRLRPTLGLAFQSADVARVERLTDADGRERCQVDTTFLGLYGSDSPLPHFVTEELLDDDEASIARGFLDLFHHRMLSLFYRTWEKYRHYQQFERDGSDAFSGHLFGLVGFGTARPPAGAPVPAVLLLRYAAQLTRSTCSAASLAAVLGDYFPGIPVRVEPCAARWVALTADGQNRLGARNATLGEDVSLGAAVFDRSGRFRVALGPLGLDDFLRFLPGGDEAAALEDLLRTFVRDPLEHERELTLAHAAIPPLALGGPLARLGLTTWLGRPAGDAPVLFAPAQEN